MVNPMGRILVRWKSCRIHVEMLCHPICNWQFQVYIESSRTISYVVECNATSVVILYLWQAHFSSMFICDRHTSRLLRRSCFCTSWPVAAVDIYIFESNTISYTSRVRFYVYWVQYDVKYDFIFVEYDTFHMFRVVCEFTWIEWNTTASTCSYKLNATRVHINRVAYDFRHGECTTTSSTIQDWLNAMRLYIYEVAYSYICVTARCTSRPSGGGSRLEAVSFRGSRLDSRPSKWRKGSEGRELGSGVRLLWRGCSWEKKFVLLEARVGRWSLAAASAERFKLSWAWVLEWVLSAQRSGMVSRQACCH